MRIGTGGDTIVARATPPGEGGVAKIHGFYGRYDLEVHAGDRSLCTEIHLSADAKRDVTVTL